VTNREKEYLLFPQERDLRLDFFRGIGQWMIFLDHIPFDVVNWLTFRNYGFSDAAELFVFISGYTAGFVYGPAMREARAVAATARLRQLSHLLENPRGSWRGRLTTDQIKQRTE
jgi:hypothetical protein